jgi:hypothetical protein
LAGRRRFLEHAPRRDCDLVGATLVVYLRTGHRILFPGCGDD